MLSSGDFHMKWMTSTHASIQKDGEQSCIKMKDSRRFFLESQKYFWLSNWDYNKMKLKFQKSEESVPEGNPVVSTYLREVHTPHSLQRSSVSSWTSSLVLLWCHGMHQIHRNPDPFLLYVFVLEMEWIAERILDLICVEGKTLSPF